MYLFEAKKFDLINILPYNSGIVVIPSKRRRCGPGFDPRQVHHKEISMNDNLGSLAIGVVVVLVVFALVLL
jgi:hypothetical protein